MLQALELLFTRLLNQPGATAPAITGFRRPAGDMPVASPASIRQADGRCFCERLKEPGAIENVSDPPVAKALLPRVTAICPCVTCNVRAPLGPR